MKESMVTILQDVRFALRQLARSRGFAVTGMLTLSLTVGLAATVFSVFDALLLRPLPFGDPAHIVVLDPRSPSGYGQPASWPEYKYWRQNNHTLSGLTGFASQTMNMRGPAGPVAISAVHGSENFFDVLGARPLLGRTFLPEEGVNGHTDVAVLSYSLWQKQFSGRRDVVGSVVELDGGPMTVIGVMPQSFRFPLQLTDAVYAPFRLAKREQDWERHWMRTIARLKPGVSKAAAEADLNRVLAEYGRIQPQDAGRRMQLETLSDSLLGSTRGLLQVLVLAVAAVLALGCVNIGGLMLVRGMRRERELALRSAIGASRAQLARQLFAELAVLAVLGTFGGVVAAWLLLHAVQTLLAASLERGSEITLNPAVIAASLAAALFTLIMAGLLPARQLLSVAPAQALRSGGPASGTSRRDTRLGGAFIAAQMALAMVLLLTSGLLLRTLSTLRHTDLGFAADHLLIEDVNLSPGTIKGQDVLRTFYQPLLEQVRALPGVESAGLINMLPVQDYGFNSEVKILGQPPAPKNQERLAELRVVDPGYYSATKPQLLRGRLPDDRLDTETSQPVIVVNEAFAHKFFAAGEDPIGRHIDDWNNAMIVGVVSNQRQSLYQSAFAEMDIPAAQIPAGYRNNYLQEMQLVVHTRIDPLALADPLQQIFRKLDPGLPFRPVQTMADIVAASLVLQRMESWLFGTFAVLAVLLAALGLYGLIAQQVEQGRRDVGVRMALGAQRWQVLSLMLRRISAVSLAGLATGLLASFALRRVISSVLTVRVQHEALLIVLLVAGLEAIALLAAAIPVSRAASVNPVEVLRTE